MNTQIWPGAFSLAPFESSMQPYHFSSGVPRMPFRLLLLICFLLPASPAFGDEAGPSPLSIGASAPDFCLPGIDGQTHCLKDYRSEEHTSELQSRLHLVCRLLLEKKKTKLITPSAGAAEPACSRSR